MTDRRCLDPLSGGFVALVAAIAITATPMLAQAFGSEGHAWGGAGAANVNHAAPTAFGWWGPSVRSGLVIHATDFWRLTADAGASHHFGQTIDDEPAGPHTVVSAALGARYTFDVFTYVPYAELAGVVHPLGAPSTGSPGGELFSARIGLGLDYRMSREWSVGAAVRLHAPVTQPADFPHYSTLHLQAGYHFRL